jgi:hypothetical protein
MIFKNENEKSTWTPLGTPGRLKKNTNPTAAGMDFAVASRGRALHVELY